MADIEALVSAAEVVARVAYDVRGIVDRVEPVVKTACADVGQLRDAFAQGVMDAKAVAKDIPASQFQRPKTWFQAVKQCFTACGLAFQIRSHP